MPITPGRLRYPTSTQKGTIKPYHGGGEKAIFAPWVYALHDVHKNRDKTIRDIYRFIPPEKKIPHHFLIRWMEEAENGDGVYPPRMKIWITDALQADEQQELREATLEGARTFRHFAKKMREDGELPPGGVVGLKYLADAAGFLAGKRAEANTAAGGKPNQTANVNKFVLNLGERPAKKTLKSKVIEAEVKVLESGNSGS